MLLQKHFPSIMYNMPRLKAGGDEIHSELSLMSLDIYETFV